jgi:hypothetical protein
MRLYCDGVVEIEEAIHIQYGMLFDDESTVYCMWAIQARQAHNYRTTRYREAHRSHEQAAHTGTDILR